MKIHNIFHPNLLQKALIDPSIGEINMPVPLVIINNEKKWEVEDIFNAKVFKKNLILGKLDKLGWRPEMVWCF